MIDGDTIDVHGERIRLLDIDAPESQQICTDYRGGIDFQRWFCGAVAANKLSDWIGARTVTRHDADDEYAEGHHFTCCPGLIHDGHR